MGSTINGCTSEQLWTHVLLQRQKYTRSRTDFYDDDYSDDTDDYDINNNNNRNKKKDTD